MLGQNIPNEAEIIRHWKAGQGISVSVVCPTFNQVAYIEDAIGGFLKQKTTFPFEIIIHDDASSDGTTEIIERYSRKYPNLIKPIVQTENQYSRGGFRPLAYAAQSASGRYIAPCEGDDYWISDDKLQRQFCALEEHPGIGLCVHNAECIDQNGKVSAYKFPGWSDKNKIIAYKHVFTSPGQFAPTASMLIRKDVFTRLPAFFYRAPIGDFFLEVFAGGNGVYYLPEKMSVYRRGLPGAWSDTVLKDTENRIKFNQSMLLALAELRKYLGTKEARLVKYKKQYVYFDLANAYLEKGERLLSLKAWLHCFLGAPKLKRHFSILMRHARRLPTY